VISRYPQVFSVKVNGLYDKAKFFQTNMALTQWREVSYIISMFPPVLWLSEDNLLEKASFLKKELDVNEAEFRDILITYPQILGLAVTRNLRPKVNFLLDDSGAGLTRDQLKEFVSYQPALLAYSLEGRIRPRIMQMRKHYISFAYAPPHLMSYSDSKFEEWFNTQVSTWSIN
jgi:hypothetical protein